MALPTTVLQELYGLLDKILPAMSPEKRKVRNFTHTFFKLRTEAYTSTLILLMGEVTCYLHIMYNRALLKVISKFFFNIFIVYYTLMSPKKYFAKNLEFCVPSSCYLILRQVQRNNLKIRQTAVSLHLSQY